MTVRVKLSRRTCLWLARRMDTLNHAWLGVLFLWPSATCILMWGRSGVLEMIVENAPGLTMMGLRLYFGDCPLTLIQRAMLESLKRPSVRVAGQAA